MPERSRLIFRKSSYSSGKGQDCVEIADTGTGAAVRDTKNRNLGYLEFPGVEWAAFLDVTRVR